MPHAIVNLASPVVSERINQLLLEYPNYPYQQAFAAPDLRHKLKSYVLKRLPTRYVQLKENQVCSLESPSNCYSEEQLRHIEALVKQGIASLSDQLPLAQFSENQPVDMMPSSWFG